MAVIPALRHTCLDIFRTVEILAPGRIRVGERIVSCSPETLLAHLQAEIYGRFFAGFREVPAGTPTAELLAALRAAKRHRPRVAEWLANVPHSYTVLQSVEATPSWLRLYWNLGPQGAAVLVEKTMQILGAGTLPFRLKVMLDTSRRRRDGAVLYVPVAGWRAAATLLHAAYDDIAKFGDLEPEPPLFARRVRSGVGLAEDPGSPHSFGTHRAQLVALAIVDTYQSRSHGDEERWRALAARFEAAGLSLECPHLNARKADPYEMGGCANSSATAAAMG